MGSFTLAVETSLGYDEAVALVRERLAEQGFGILTEIDLAATLKAKLGADIPSQVILGACRPQLAHEAIQANPSVAAVLPCNVVVRSVAPGRTVVEAFDPATMVALAGDEDAALRAVAEDASERLRAALAALPAV